MKQMKWIAIPVLSTWGQGHLWRYVKVAAGHLNLKPDKSPI